MKYVKLVARKDTWFKEGTEVYDYDENYEDKKHVTLQYWNECLLDGNGICVRGIRVCEDNPNETRMGCKIGEERIDGEYCGCDEFDVTEIEE